jgi:hypothetical protein
MRRPSQPPRLLFVGQLVPCSHWNNAVPNVMRGRLAGIAMISYMSGPLLGNARAGWVASLTSVSVSLWTGGAACIIA